MRLMERYSQAINSGDLSVDERTTMSDTDVLGAAGLASRHNALGIALTRLFADGKPEGVIQELTEMAFKRARTMNLRLSRLQAQDVSQAVLGWYRFGVCQPCGGTGFQRVKDTPTLGDECPHCIGTGKLQFDRQFPEERLSIARWLSTEIDRAQAAAGSAALAMLAPRL